MLLKMIFLAAVSMIAAASQPYTDKRTLTIDGARKVIASAVAEAH